MNNPQQPMPMQAQWAFADQLVDELVVGLRANPMTSADLAMQILTIEQVANKTQLLAMIASTALQKLVAQQ